MKYNRSEIMRGAWHIFRRNMGFYTFAESLKISWQREKEEMGRKAAEEARQNAPKTAAQVKAKDDLFILNMKDRWDDRDRAEVARLERLIRGAA